MGSSLSARVSSTHKHQITEQPHKIPWLHLMSKTPLQPFSVPHYYSYRYLKKNWFTYSSRDGLTILCFLLKVFAFKCTPVTSTGDLDPRLAHAFHTTPGDALSHGQPIYWRTTWRQLGHHFKRLTVASRCSTGDHWYYFASITLGEGSAVRAP